MAVPIKARVKLDVESMVALVSDPNSRIGLRIAMQTVYPMEIRFIGATPQIMPDGAVRVG